VSKAASLRLRRRPIFIKLNRRETRMPRSVSAIAVVAAALLASATARAADDKPRLAPLRDVEVVYRISDAQKQGGETVRVTYASGGRKARLDFFRGADVENVYGSTIIDQDADRVLLLLPLQHAYVEQPAGPARALPFPLDATMHFTAGGAAVVAGRNCREWQVENQDTKGTACVTEDGVVLRGVRSAPIAGTIEAMSVVYTPQPAALFAPPPGYTKLVRVPRDPLSSSGGDPR
jgi:hypothetical protein